MRVVLLVIGPELGCSGNHKRKVGEEGQQLVVQRFAESKKMAELMLCCEQILIGCAADGIGCQENLPPGHVTHPPCHGKLH